MWSGAGPVRSLRHRFKVVSGTPPSICETCSALSSGSSATRDGMWLPGVVPVWFIAVRLSLGRCRERLALAPLGQKWRLGDHVAANRLLKLLLEVPPPPSGACEPRQPGQREGYG